MWSKERPGCRFHINLAAEREGEGEGVKERKWERKRKRGREQHTRKTTWSRQINKTRNCNGWEHKNETTIPTTNWYKFILRSTHTHTHKCGWCICDRQCVSAFLLPPWVSHSLHRFYESVYNCCRSTLPVNNRPIKCLWWMKVVRERTNNFINSNSPVSIKPPNKCEWEEEKKHISRSNYQYIA